MTVDRSMPKLIAAVDAIGRTGAREFEVGYLDETPDAARWWASALYQGTKVHEQDHSSPADAADALARRLLDGGLCTHCGRTVTTQSLANGQCRWVRIGKVWTRGCE